MLSSMYFPIFSPVNVRWNYSRSADSLDFHRGASVDLTGAQFHLIRFFSLSVSHFHLAFSFYTSLVVQFFSFRCCPVSQSAHVFKRFICVAHFTHSRPLRDHLTSSQCTPLRRRRFLFVVCFGVSY